MPSVYDFYAIDPEIIGYYITAYGIAVKHGYTGTEQEWLKSLKGEEGTPTEMRYNSDLDQIEWKLKTDSDWTGVLPLATIRGQAFTQAVEDIRQSTQEAANKAAEATASASKAENERISAVQAKTEAERLKGEAEAARDQAQEHKAGAEQIKNQTATIKGETEALKTETEQIKQQTEAVKGQAELARDEANTARGLAEQAAQQAEQHKDGAQSAQEQAQAHKTEAETAKTTAESWAIGGTGTRAGENTNNAKYWSQVAENAAGGGVSSFNGRSGAVVPMADDYAAFFPAPPEIVDDLATNDSTKTLSAAQGYTLNLLVKENVQYIREVGGTANNALAKAEQAFTSASNGKKAVAAAITGKGVAATGSDSFSVLANKIGQIRQGSGNATPEQVLSGRTFSNDQGDQTGTMPNRGNWSSNMSINGRVVIPQGYHAGGGAVTADVVPGRTIMPTTYPQTAIGPGSIARDTIRVAGDPDLRPNNIRQGVNIFGVQGTDDGGRSVIANALTNKGIPTPTGYTAQQIANNIQNANIPLILDIDYIIENTFLFKQEGSVYKKYRDIFYPKQTGNKTNMTAIHTDRWFLKHNPLERGIQFSYSYNDFFVFQLNNFDFKKYRYFLYWGIDIQFFSKNAAFAKEQLTISEYEGLKAVRYVSDGHVGHTIVPVRHGIDAIGIINAHNERIFDISGVPNLGTGTWYIISKKAFTLPLAFL